MEAEAEAEAEQAVAAVVGVVMAAVTPLCCSAAVLVLWQRSPEVSIAWAAFTRTSSRFQTGSKHILFIEIRTLWLSDRE